MDNEEINDKFELIGVDDDEIESGGVLNDIVFACKSGGVLNDIVFACKSGDLEKVKEIYTKHGSSLIDNEHVICSAIRGDHLEIVKYLADNGASLHVIYLASSLGKLDIVKYLKEKGGSLGLAIEGASRSGHVGVVEYLLKDIEDINIVIKDTLALTAMEGHIEVVKLLVEHGADVNAEGGKALLRASKFGHLDIVKYLIEKGCNADIEESSSICLAARYGHTEIVKYLHSQGYNIDRAIKNADEMIVEILVEYKEEVGKKIVSQGNVSQKIKL